MSYTRYRAPSPDSGGFFDPMRASTGNMAFSSETDPYYYPSRSAYDGYNTSRIAGDRHLDPYYRTHHQPRRSPRLSNDWAPDWQPNSSKTHRLSDKPSTSRTAYSFRPRSNTSSVADSNRRPLSLIVPSSPNRHEGVRSPRQQYYYAQDGGERYIVPASSLPARHRRIVSADEREKDTGRPDRPSYLSSGGNNRRTYIAPPVGARPREIDTHDAYSYTNAREQFYNDAGVLRGIRRESHRGRKDRPLSLAVLERNLPQLSSDRKSTKLDSSSRRIDRSERDELHRNPDGKIEGSDGPGTSEMAHRRTSSRTPVSVHQNRDAPPYDEEHDDPRESRRYRERYDDLPAKDEYIYQNDRNDLRRAAPIAGGLATAGLASGYSKGLRGREYESDAEARPEHDRFRESGRRREPRRDERPARYDSGSETDEYHSDIESGRYRHQPVGHRRDRHRISADTRREHRRERSKDESDPESHRQTSRHQHERVSLDDRPTDPKSTDASDGRQEELQPSEPVSKELEVVPKGILKPPTEKFPEDHNAVREGVAPLKDANKKGIPTGARWTKVDRRLVSPAALEGQERYEARDDYVIVLRVLTREEIQEYAIKTADIRSRYDYGRRRRDESKERRHHDSDDESSEEEKKPKALPAPEPPSEPKRFAPPESHTEPIKMWLQRG